MTPLQARDVLRSSNLTGQSLLALLDQIVPIVVSSHTDSQARHAQQTSTQAGQTSTESAGWDSVPLHQLESRAAML